MLRTLRRRLILSHVLPLLIVLPLMGASLVYALETRFLTPALSRELEGDARLLAVIAGDQPEIWEDPQYARSILNDPRVQGAARVTLLDTRGEPVAATDGDAVAPVDDLPDQPQFTAALAGATTTRLHHDPHLDDVFDIMTPIVGGDGRVVGVLRLTYSHATMFEELLQLRYVIALVVLVGLGLGAALGYVLATSISTPIQRVGQAIYDLARGERRDPLPVGGPLEIRRQVTAVNVLLERLHRLEEARRQLLANLVHELGRPLGALRSSLSAMERGAREDPQLLAEILEGMDQGLARLQSLLEELTHLHGQVLGPLELDRQPVVLQAWLPQAMRPWQELAGEKGQRWEATIPAHLPPVMADPLRLSQAIGNLASNAIKYTAADGAIFITAGESDEEVWIKVCDTGPGVASEELDAIFTPFFRGAQEKRIKQGMGLGLTIAHDVVVAHGGHIEVQSERGAGSHFSIYLPRSTSAPPPAAP